VAVIWLSADAVVAYYAVNDSVPKSPSKLKTLREAVRSRDFTFTAELQLAPGMNAIAMLEQARALSPAVDALQIPDHPNARPHISNMAAGALLVQNGMDPVLQLNCRDRNRIALQSNILGAQALGINNLLLLRGRDLPADHRPKASNVFDVGAIDLIATAAAIKNGEALAGGELPDSLDFYLGAVATVFRPGADWTPETLIAKAEAGAQFIQMQLCFDMAILRTYMERLVAAKLMWRFHVLIGMAPLPSADAARHVKHAFPDSIIPDEIIGRLEQARDAEQEGVQICAELLQEIAEIPGVSGANLVTPGDPATIPAAVRASGLRQDMFD
jgi:methylenetetrahydrofolate reductase (NADPH)